MFAERGENAPQIHHTDTVEVERSDGGTTDGCEPKFPSPTRALGNPASYTGARRPLRHAKARRDPTGEPSRGGARLEAAPTLRRTAVAVRSISRSHSRGRAAHGVPPE